MAEKKKSIYSRKLKDVNKDGKRNFADTWLGDLIGADGKAGVQKDKLKASLKGSRRESGMKDTAKTTAKTTAPKKRMSTVDTTDDKRAARKSTSTVKPSMKDTTDDKRAARKSTSSGPAPKFKGVTWDEYLSIDANNALKKLAYGLPSGMSKREFTTKAREEQSAKAKKARLDTTDDARARRKRVEPGGPNLPGMSKGGMTKKSAYKKGGMVKANCGDSMKPNGRAKP